MRVFDYVALLDELGRPHDTKTGGLIKGNNSYSQCPFCSADDPSEHLGFNVTNGKWGCWRDDRHRGSNPYRLVRELTGWSHAAIMERVGGDAPAPSPDDWEELGRRMRATGDEAQAPPVTFQFEPEFRRFNNTGYDCLRFVRYLEKRGFHKRHVQKVARLYRLRWTLTGRFRWRLIIPIEDERGMLGWTARAVHNASLRYLAHPPGDGVKRTVFNFNHAAAGGLVLVVVEGPMDALKLDFYGRRRGVRAVALMGTWPTAEQEDRVRLLMERFSSLVVCLDDTARVQTMRLVQRFAYLDAVAAKLPDGRKDPGELRPEEAKAFTAMLAASVSAETD